MRGLLSGWDSLDPALARLLRANLCALVGSTVVLAVVYALGFRPAAVLVDLGVMVASILLMLVSLPLAPRYGAPAALGAFTLSAGAFAVVGTWATPVLSPLGSLLMLVPMLLAIPHVSRRSLNALSVLAILGSAGVAALGEWRRREALNDLWWVNAIVIAASLPAAVMVVSYLVRDAYHRLADNSVQLAESRTRVVEVADAARRSLERDLHDGAQQRLLAMSVTIERTRKELQSPGRDGAEELLRQLASDNRAVISELRELARGIYPPLLTERGLVPAIQSAARRSVVPVTLDAESFPRPAPQVEVAAYFCIMEALTNAAKHSGATAVRITLRCAPRLVFTVSDNGRGFDATTVSRGGLLGMEARAAAAGGAISLDTAPGRGTSLTGTFPLDAAG